MCKRLLIALISFLFPLLSLQASGLKTSAVQLAQPTINQDTLADIVEQKDYFIRQKRLLLFIKDAIQRSRPDRLQAVQDTFNAVFARYELHNKDAYRNFLKSFSLYKQRSLRDAENYMNAAVQLAVRHKEHYLAYQFYTHLGFIQTDRGNFISAIYDYRMAIKEVIQIKDKFKDNRPQASLNINISDLYYKTGFYAQSLNYLDKAWSQVRNDEATRDLLSSVIFYNKSENYFRLGNLDSLKLYHQKLNDPRNKNYKIFTYRQRTAYYINLLRQDYDLAIKQILSLKKNKSYAPSDLEDQRLADAYYQNGQLDSSSAIINRLLKADVENNHPEIQYHLYETLAWIAGKKGDFKTASNNFMMALKQSQENTSRLTQVGNISSQIQIDETENAYLQQTQEYERERLWLIFIVIIAALSLIAVALIYRNVKQKRHYENLLFATKKAELSFINSHEVRKHLTNILGIMDIIRHSDNNREEYKQCEDYLLSSAKRLDEAIKNISEKINE